MIKLRITFAQNRTGAEKRHKVSGFEEIKSECLQFYQLIFLAAEPQLRCGINRMCAVAAFNALKQMIPGGVVGGINKVKTCAVDSYRVK